MIVEAKKKDEIGRSKVVEIRSEESEQNKNKQTNKQSKHTTKLTFFGLK
jgi:hypothetical protein